MGNFLGWQNLWHTLNPDEQEEAVDNFLEFVESGKDEALRQFIWKRMARACNFRPEFVSRLTGEKRRMYFKQRIGQILIQANWDGFLGGYLRNCWHDLCVRVSDSFGIEHDDTGCIDEDLQLPDDEKIRTVVSDLEEEFSARQLFIYFNYLLLSDECWAPLKPEYVRLRHKSGHREDADSHREVVPGAAIENHLPEHDRQLYAEFTTLDRVLIDQIVGTVSGMEGALSEDELADLVDTVICLNAKRHRSYFHMGFMDALLTGHEVSLDRPGFNDLRKAWYLAGVLIGFARQRDDQEIRNTIQQYNTVFEHAARQAGGPGAAMAKTLFILLVELNDIPDAVKLLRGQIKELGIEFAFLALEQATDFIRARDPASAMPLLEILREHLPELDDQSAEFGYLSTMVRRRMGQCLQAQGDLEGAKALFHGLYNEPENQGFYEIGGDLGLVEGGFRSLLEVRIPIDKDTRTALAEQLERGRQYFRLPEEQEATAPANCAYPLAVLEYIEYATADDARRDQLRDDALHMVQRSTTAMQSSLYAEVFQSKGLLGQALFMQAVLQMDRLNPVDAKSAMAAWSRITEVAGDFPLDDIKRLLSSAEAVDKEIARELAESIWNYRHVDAMDIFLDSDALLYSEALRKQIAEEVTGTMIPDAERWRVWEKMVPICIQTQDIDLASQGLDQMEMLAENRLMAQEYLQFLSDQKNYNPVWNEKDAKWSRIKILRLLGEDEQCGAELRELFFLVRDGLTGEGEQILELSKEWWLPEHHYADLELPANQQVKHDIADDGRADRLKNGERLKLLFIGGNETQARYDDKVKEELNEQWPGVHIDFVHTGWSSNWGRELDQLLMKANGSDAVVLMKFMRTMLGKKIREALEVPWIACTSTGRTGVLRSIQKAALVALDSK